MDSKEQDNWWEAYKTGKREAMLGPMKEHFPEWTWDPYINRPGEIYAQLMVFGYLGELVLKVIGIWQGAEVWGFTLAKVPKDGPPMSKTFAHTGNESFGGCRAFHVTHQNGPIQQALSHFLARTQKISALLPVSAAKVSKGGDVLNTLRGNFPRWDWTLEPKPQGKWVHKPLVAKGRKGALSLRLRHFWNLEEANYTYNLILQEPPWTPVSVIRSTPQMSLRCISQPPPSSGNSPKHFTSF